jgi:hypothetical protein
MSFRTANLGRPRRRRNYSQPAGSANEASTSSTSIAAAQTMPAKEAATETQVKANMFRILWEYIHAESFHIQYTEEDPEGSGRRAGFALLLQALSQEMRCDACRAHLAAYLQAHPIGPQTDLARYAVDLHNAVNRRQGKREIPFEVASEYYLSGNENALCPALGRCALPPMQPCHVGLVIGAVVLIVLVILFCAYWQNRRV